MKIRDKKSTICKGAQLVWRVCYEKYLLDRNVSGQKKLKKQIVCSTKPDSRMLRTKCSVTYQPWKTR